VESRDTLYVGTDFGAGSLTDSGYPRIVKEWKRAHYSPLPKIVFEGKKEDVSVSAAVVHDHGHKYEFINRGVTFFTSEQFIRRGDDWVKFDKPDDPAWALTTIRSSFDCAQTGRRAVRPSRLARSCGRF